MRRAFPSLILLIAISLGSLLFRLGSLPLSGADEPRYARIAQEMHERGTWITPLLEGKPWLEKPPLYYWMSSPLYFLFKSHETAARVAPATCALVTALAIFWLGSMLWTRLSGLLGSLILLTSLGFAGFGRSANTDIPFTCCLTLALAILALAGVKDIGRKVLGAYVFLGLAVLGKGPVAVVLAAGIGLCVWFFDERGVVLRRWRVLPGLVITAAVALPWFWLALRQNGYTFIATFFINHNLARYVTDIHHHSEPIYYFLPALLALLLPWSGWLLLLVPKSLMEGLRRWRQWNTGMLFLGCWVLFPVIFFSLSESKLAGYILPSLPPLALILGVQVSRWIEASVEPPRLRASSGLNLMVSAAMATAAPFYFQKEYGGNWQIGLLLSITILVPALFAFVYGLRGSLIPAFKATVLQGLIVIVATAQFAYPVIGSYLSTRDIAHSALNLQRSGEPIITYRLFDHTLYYYTGYGIAGESDSPESLRSYAEAYRDTLVVTNTQGFAEISDTGGLSVALLDKQGPFLLLRISAKK